MKTWRYVEPGLDNESVYVTKTEDEIIAEFYPWWSEKLKSLGREHLISRENCIEDWVVVHWAWEVQDADKDPH